MRLSFKVWLQEADSLYNTPDGGGEVWDQKSNTDAIRRNGGKSKNVGDGPPAGHTDFDPDEMYLGDNTKKGCKKK